MIAVLQSTWARLRGAMAGGSDGLPVRLSSRSYGGTRGPAVRDMGFDQPLLWVVVTLLAWGLVMVYSASIALPDNPRFGNYAPTHFVTRHAFFMSIGLLAAVVAFQFPMHVWEKLAPWLFALTLVLLALVLIPQLGKAVNGARRWIPLGVMNFQPSELAKLAVLLYAADYMVRKMEVKERFFRAVMPMAFAVGVVGMLLLAQPDMGAFMVIVVIGAFAVMVMTSEFRRARVFAYLDPWSVEHALGKGYQLSHSLIAFGRGEIFGVGLGGSVEKLHWLPEAHTDFLLAVIGEEFGLIGVLLLIGLFLWLTRRIMDIGRQAIALDQVFSGLVAQGIGVWMGFQSFINIGVNLGALPTKGLTLPLMSYGGSAILINLVALAIVLRIDYENRQMMRGGRK